MNIVRLRHSVFMACALTLAMWFASTLGLVHGIVHTPGLPLAQTAHSGLHRAANATGGVAEHVTGKTLLGAMAALFTDHHGGDAQCRIYDQLSQGPAAIAVPLVVLPLLLPAATFDFFQGEALARWVALFQARGPPSTR